MCKITQHIPLLSFKFYLQTNTTVIYETNHSSLPLLASMYSKTTFQDINLYHNKQTKFISILFRKLQVRHYSRTVLVRLRKKSYTFSVQKVEFSVHFHILHHASLEQPRVREAFQLHIISSYASIARLRGTPPDSLQRSPTHFTYADH